jgi:hypothetical protein
MWFSGIEGPEYGVLPVERFDEPSIRRMFSERRRWYHFNKFMGGVDLADMIWLSCNSNIMGGKRWWLRLFFYNLDVGTLKARVLYNKQLKVEADNNGTEYIPMNIVQFKMKLVEDLAGKRIHNLLHGSPEDEETMTEHRCIQIPNGAQARCAYCSSRTTYQCIGCGVPLCHMGNGQVKYDCFREAHETEDRREMVLAKYLQMQMKNSRLIRFYTEFNKDSNDA